MLPSSSLRTIRLPGDLIRARPFQLSWLSLFAADCAAGRAQDVRPVGWKALTSFTTSFPTLWLAGVALGEDDLRTVGRERRREEKRPIGKARELPQLAAVRAHGVGLRLRRVVLVVVRAEMM